MLFNSLDFALFFPIVFIGYWFIFNKNLTAQNTFLPCASYFFYANWDWRFVFLLAFSTLVNYIFALQIAKQHMISKRKFLLGVIIVIDAVLLCYFKYFNFFIESFTNAFSLFNIRLQFSLINVILPLGISFYTFQNISYVTDVYRKHTEPVKNLLHYSVYISFFPILISGPIERANHFVSQIAVKRLFNYPLAVNGMRMILLGLFEKVVIADSCGAVVNTVYNNFESHSGSTLFFTAVLYSFQIYGDFSGYSHIAIGCAALLGFSLRDNFNYPYLAKNIADFWRRWHISFSSWLRDYIYFPLGGSRRGDLIQIRNLFIVFVFSGLWHGANLTFVIYGCIHALFFVLYFYYKRWDTGSKTTVVGNILAILSTFTVLTLARVFFRSGSVQEAVQYLSVVFSKSLFSKPEVSRLMLLLLVGYVFLEWLQRHKQHVLDVSFIRSKYLRYSIYLAMLFAVFYFSGQAQSFVYFKF
jgi:alginate O-acetyltransferase complex protein AlgI